MYVLYRLTTRNTCRQARSREVNPTPRSPRVGAVRAALAGTRGDARTNTGGQTGREGAGSGSLSEVHRGTSLPSESATRPSVAGKSVDPGHQAHVKYPGRAVHSCPGLLSHSHSSWAGTLARSPTEVGLFHKNVPAFKLARDSSAQRGFMFRVVTCCYCYYCHCHYQQCATRTVGCFSSYRSVSRCDGGE
jgi:hypothetical protein